jgi:DNA mismatch repair protein MutS
MATLRSRIKGRTAAKADDACLPGAGCTGAYRIRDTVCRPCSPGDGARRVDSDSITESLRFRSILWPAAQADGLREDIEEPACFHDLNLDQLVAAITQAWPDENLAPFFRTPLRDVEAVAYRQAVFRDLEHLAMRSATDAFTQSMRDVHARRAGIEKLYYPYEKERAFLGAADAYCSAVQTLAGELDRLQPASNGLRALRTYSISYLASAAFAELAMDADELKSALNDIDYGLVIRSGSVTVRPYEGETDASVDIEATFAKFRLDAAKDYRSRHRGRIGVNGLNHIEAQILDKIALLHPQPFAALDAFCTQHEHFIDPTIERFAREACFYLAWLAYIEPIRRAGLPFCYPAVDAASKNIEAADAFDVVLAAQRVKERQPVVGNGFALHGAERLLVVSGPNHGGKTTFARMFGQLHWLAALGCTVPGKHARAFLFDRLFTHFEKEENIDTLRGKLQDDLFRIHRILEQATPRSVIVLNEIFASTTLDDALWLGRRIMAQLSRLDALGVCVTFLDELAAFDEKTVSMVAAVDPRDPAVRTFKVTRRPPDGLAYALAVAEKHRVTRDWLLRRIAP